ncbi:MAG: valine--tRNA ligase [Deltaproteobacteria bacterium]
MTQKVLEKAYEPKDVEEKWLVVWLAQSANQPEAASSKPSFSMVIPPPNITGALHLGHALNSTLQDVLARYKRMKGFNVLWLPGIDHAGIATQNVVERQLAEKGKSRGDLGREAFIEAVWKWKEESGHTIINQLKRLGASCDWSRQRFTMDEGLSKAVREVFTRLYAEGLIYRGDYIINWCPRCATALSDLEVNFNETDGFLWHIEYPLTVRPRKGGRKGLVVATTRPETMLGDTAVAVNPNDERYAALIGKSVVLPIVNREIPIIADSSVDMEFGTGVVKITPAHDFNDFETGKRHNLPVMRVMESSAKMNENAGRFAGLDRSEARERIVAALEDAGLLRATEKYKVMLGSCYRCSTVVEPTLSMQWFVKTGPLAAPAIKAVEDGRIRFVPKGWENTYFDWMRNIRDWCVSRQIWWGHRIPAWHCVCGHITVAALDPSACEKCGSKEITQDSDVLDTWFSSALWPFSTLGWPDQTEDLKRFYPTSVLSTSFDIIFFWVARMIMMGMKFMDAPPFRDVYIHALIRDAEGQKMSKSKGNVIDPLVMMERYGTDAFRFSLAAYAGQGRDIKLSEENISGYRNFCNKLWNLTRFTLMNAATEGKDAAIVIDSSSLTMADKWILTRRNQCVSEVSEAIESYRFDEAARSLYRFVWAEVCDWYVELIKQDLKGDAGEERKKAASAVLASALKDVFKLLHPFMPFITEELYGFFGDAKSGLMMEPFPVETESYADEATAMEGVMDVIRAVRNIRTDMNVALGAKVEAVCRTSDEQSKAMAALTAGAEYIKQLAKVSKLTLSGSTTDAPEKGAASAMATVLGATVEVFVPLAGHIDVAAELFRLAKEMEKLTKELDGVEKRLASSDFVEKAPPEVVEKERARLASLMDKLAKLRHGLGRISLLG